MFCPQCGEKDVDGFAFCPSCGARLNQSSNGVPSGTPTKNTYAPPQPTPVNVDSQPKKGYAIASLVLGIVGVICWFFGYSSILSVILGIIGLILASSAKKSGYQGGAQTAGFILSLIATIGGALVLVACVACIGSLGAAAWSIGF